MALDMSMGNSGGEDTETCIFGFIDCCIRSTIESVFSNGRITSIDQQIDLLLGIPLIGRITTLFVTPCMQLEEEKLVRHAY